MSRPSRLHDVTFATRDVQPTYDFCARRLGMAPFHAEKHLMEKGWCRSIYMVGPDGIMVELTTSTHADLFEQTEEEALRLLRLPPEELTEADREDASGENVSVNHDVLRRARARRPKD